MMIRLRPGLWLGEPEAIYERTEAEYSAPTPHFLKLNRMKTADVGWYARTHSGREYAITEAERDALWAAFGGGDVWAQRRCRNCGHNPHETECEDEPQCECRNGPPAPTTDEITITNTETFCQELSPANQPCLLSEGHAGDHAR